MPRGNDSKNALHELADKFGRGVGNAERLIEGTLGRNSESLRAAELLPRDHEATKKARDQWVGTEIDDCKVIDAAVRGGVTCCVLEDENGRRWVVALDEDGKPVETDAEKQRKAKKSDDDDD